MSTITRTKCAQDQTLHSHPAIEATKHKHTKNIILLIITDFCVDVLPGLIFNVVTPPDDHLDLVAVGTGSAEPLPDPIVGAFIGDTRSTFGILCDNDNY